MIGIIPSVFFILEVATIIAARALGRMRQLKRATLKTDMRLVERFRALLDAIHLHHWAPSPGSISGCLAHGTKLARHSLIKTSARYGGGLKAMATTSTQRRRSPGGAIGSMTLVAWSMSMLVKPASAAPLVCRLSLYVVLLNTADVVEKECNCRERRHLHRYGCDTRRRLSK